MLVDFHQIPIARSGILRRTEASATALGHGVLPEGIFKISERAMGIWGKSTTINQNFVHIFFLILVTSKQFSIYPITLHLYMDEYTLLKKYLDSLCLAGVFIIKLTVTKTLFLRSVLSVTLFTPPFCQLLYGKMTLLSSSRS